jgi:NAD(P)-dependent dehydrogenase (short-subunit alcohol dehydrogenase family)
MEQPHDDAIQGQDCAGHRRRFRHQGGGDKLAYMQPVGRLGTPEEESPLTCFMLSDRASFIYGSCRFVDGAHSAQQS